MGSPDFKRIARHLLTPRWVVNHAFPRVLLARIEDAIHESETAHRGQLRFAVEGDLHPLAVLRGETPRARALALFSSLRIWDTEENSGVLIYVQLVDRRIEVVADRGISAKVARHEWDAICRRMEEAFRRGDYESGVVAGIREITVLLARHFPANGVHRDELPDRPVVL